MHEMSLSLSLVDLVCERVRTEGGTRVLRVGIEIGALGHVEPEAMAFCLESAARDTVLAGTRFEITVVPGRAWCFDCSEHYDILERGASCPGCQGGALQLQRGEELRVVDMEIA